MIALQPTPIAADALRSAVEAAHRRARTGGRPIVVSVEVDLPDRLDPLDLFAGAAGEARRFYWERPASGEALVGVGAVRAIRVEGAHRFREAAARIRADLREAVVAAEAGPGPRYVGGFAFDAERSAASAWGDLPGGLLVLPRLLFARSDGRSSLTLNAVVEPDADLDRAVDAARRDPHAALGPVAAGGDDLPVELLGRSETPSADAWRTAVARTAADVRRGAFAKVVLARAVGLRAAWPIAPEGALRRLRAAQTGATTFAVSLPGGCFVGATPERLVRLRHRAVATVALAGSIGRGDSAAEDERLAAALLASAKDRHEHEVVVDAVLEALAPVCVAVARAAGTPSVERTRSVQHLATPIAGTLRADRGVLDLVERLHPTPAVGGTPREAALIAIRQREGFDRGWYAGPIGWVDGRGDGEFVVALRSALLAGDEATLFAGGGIVGDSDPDAEYRETELKLGPMLAALGAR